MGDLETLAAARKLGVRDDPAKIVAAGQSALRAQWSSTSNEGWVMREQVVLAALDMHDLVLAEKLVGELEVQFPTSQRVSRLRGLTFEAQGETRKAAEVYDEITKVNESNTIGIKRKICLLLAAGKLDDAIKALTTYLGEFGADAEGWKELAKLHIEAGNMQQAVFCLEEVVLSNPHSYLGHLVLGEALYSLGGDATNVADARKYFCQSLLTKPGVSKNNCPVNARALFDLAVATVALDDFEKNADDKRGAAAIVDTDKNKQMNKKALDELANLKLAPGMDEIMQAALKRLSIS